jgi:hypothetical protein
LNTTPKAPTAIKRIAPMSLCEYQGIRREPRAVSFSGRTTRSAAGAAPLDYTPREAVRRPRSAATACSAQLC